MKPFPAPYSDNWLKQLRKALSEGLKVKPSLRMEDPKIVNWIEYLKPNQKRNLKQAQELVKAYAD